MRKKVVFILLVLIGLAILEGCGISQSNNQVNNLVKPVTKTPTENKVDKAKAESDTVIKTIYDNKVGNNKSSQEINKFTDEELRIFELIKKYYPDFVYSDSYTKTGENNKEMVFEKQGNLFFNAFNSYNVIYSEYRMINYFFDAGTAHRGYGSYFAIDDNTVIKFEKSLGTGAYGYRIFKNGKKIDEESKNFDNKFSK